MMALKMDSKMVEKKARPMENHLAYQMALMMALK